MSRNRRWLAVFGIAVVLDLIFIGLKSYAELPLPSSGVSAVILALVTGGVSFRLQAKTRSARIHGLIALLEGLVLSTLAILLIAASVIFIVKGRTI